MDKYDEVIDAARNKSYDEITDMLWLLRESMRQYISRKIISIGEDNVLNINLIIEPAETFGLSDSEKPCITRIEEFQGSIYIRIADDGDYDFDAMDTDSLVEICKALENY